MKQFSVSPLRVLSGRLFLLVSCLVLAGFGWRSRAAVPSALERSIQEAGSKNQTLFLIFYKEKDKVLRAMQAEVAKVVKDLGSRAGSLLVDGGSAAGKNLLETYKAVGAPLPLVLVLAPNGAVTGSAVHSCDAESLKASVLGPGGAACLKHIQDGKLVVLCVQNAKSEGAAAVTKAVAVVQKDPRVGGLATSVVIDPADRVEKPFLEMLAVNPEDASATTLLIVPPGRIVGFYSGAVEGEKLLGDLVVGLSGGCSSCGGCGACGEGGCGEGGE